MANEITTQTFDDIIANSTLPVLVDFWAPWCGPCRALGPTLEQIAEENVGKFDFYKCNVDDEGDLAMRFNIVSIPTVILFKGCQPALALTGNRAKADLEAEINANL